MNSEKKPTKLEHTATTLAVAGGVMLYILRRLGALFHVLLIAFLWVLQALGRGVAAIWRFVGVLDSALWRATKIIARNAWRVATIGGGWALSAAAGFFSWLPTRWGRAYSAFSSFVLIIACLWIIDELRMANDDVAGASFTFQAPVDKADPILARIDGRYVHLSEVEAAAHALGFLREEEQLTPQRAFARELVKTFVEQQLLANAASEAGLMRKPHIVRKLSAARDRILAASYMENRIEEAVTPDSVQALYRSQSGVTKLGDEIRARHILVATKDEADDILAELSSGVAFEELARERSMDRATAPLSGEVGYFTQGMMTGVFSQAAFATAVGDIAPPFETEFGWHVLQVLDRRPTQAASFEEVRAEIQRFLTLRMIDATLSELAEASDVVYFRPETGNVLRDGPPTGSENQIGVENDAAN